MTQYVEGQSPHGGGWVRGWVINTTTQPCSQYFMVATFCMATGHPDKP